MRYLLSVVLGLFLVGCQAPELHRFRVNTLTEERTIPLSVGDIRVVSEVQQYDRMPHIEKTLPVTPERALTEWAENRFTAADISSPVTAVITIEKADMTQQEEKGANWYTLDNDSYKLTYKVAIEFERRDKTLYRYDVDGWESSSLPQRSSIADKEKTFMKMMNAMVRKVNQQITDAIPDTFRAD